MKIWLKAGKTTGFLLVCLVAYATAISAISEEINWQKMYKDLSILEGVLEKLVHYQNRPSLASFPGRDRIRGAYVENYGALFLVSSGQIPRLAIGMGHEHAEAKSPPEESRKEVAAEFLGTYCNTLGQLKDSDRITLLFDAPSAEHDFTYYLSDLGNLGKHLEFDVVREVGHGAKDVEVRIRAAHSDSVRDDDKPKMVFKRVSPSGEVQVDSMEAHRPRLLLEATARKRDLISYKRGQIGEQEFKTRIVFQKHVPEEAVVKKVDIMAGILDSAIRGKKSGPSATQTTGFYQKGLGAIFFTNQNASRHLAWTQKTQTGSRPADPHEALKSTLIETVADYGHTLKGLKSDDQIVVQVDLTGSVDFHKVMDVDFNVNYTRRARAYQFIGTPGQTPGTTDRLLLKVYKKDVDAYHARKLDLEGFRKKVTIQGI